MDKHAFKMVIWLFSKKQQLLLAYSTRQYSSYFHMRCHLFFTKNWVYVNSSRICCVEARFFVLKHMIQDCIVFLSCLIFLIFLFCMFFTHNFCSIFLMKARALHKIQKKNIMLKKICWKKSKCWSQIN